MMQGTNYPAIRLLALLVIFATAGCPSFHAGPLPGEPTRATYLEVDGTRIRYTDQGAATVPGSAVVLLHGFASALETWKAVVPVLATEHRVVALDLKGFGWTGRPPGDYSPQAQAKLVWGLLDRLKIATPSVVGHSWGCSVALAMALERPQRVQRLALYDAWVYEEQLPTAFLWSRASGVGEMLFGLYYRERTDEKLALAFYDKQRITEQFVEDIERALDRPGTTAAALAAVRGQRFETLQQSYRSIQQPTLILWGREDRVAPLSFGERLAAELPRCELKVYPRCGHFPMIEAQHASTADLQAFLREARR